MGTMMILCDKHVSISVRPNFFDAIVSSVACFVAGHRKLYVGEQRKMDVHCRKLLRRTVGPTAEWTTSLQNHNWNVSQSVSQACTLTALNFTYGACSLAAKIHSESVRVRPACQNRQPFQGAGTHNK